MAKEGYIQIKKGGVDSEGKKESGILVGSNMEVLEWEVGAINCISEVYIYYITPIPSGPFRFEVF